MVAGNLLCDAPGRSCRHVRFPSKAAGVRTERAAAQKKYRGAIEVVNRFAKLMSKSNKFRSALEATAEKHGIKCWHVSRLQETRMLRSRTRSISSFILDLPLLLRLSSVDDLPTKFAKTFTWIKAHLTPHLLVAAVTLCDYCWTMGPGSLITQGNRSTVISLLGDVVVTSDRVKAWGSAPGRMAQIAVRGDEFMGVSVPGLAQAAEASHSGVLAKRAIELYDEYFGALSTEEERRASIFDRRNWNPIKTNYREDVKWLVERFQAALGGRISATVAADQFEKFCRVANDIAVPRRSRSGRITSSDAH